MVERNIQSLCRFGTAVSAGTAVGIAVSAVSGIAAFIASGKGRQQ